MMARVFLNLPQVMPLQGKPQVNFSDDEDGVQSGSATGFSDGDEMVHARPAKVVSHAFDPVNRILDKIDAELSSLTYSQGTSSTATDSTVVRRTPSHESTETSRLDSDSLTISQLGPSHKPQYSPLSSGSKHTVSSDRDTGIGTGTSSFRDSHHRSRDEPVVRDLEPGDDFKNVNFGYPRRSNSPDLALLNGHHGQSDDDKSKRENQSASEFEAKQLDDKFKEIMQKRKGGFLARASADEDAQTIRTEDFADKFQDAMIYPSSDEAERLRNIEEDLQSDGGWDTDTMQQKLVSLTQPHLRKPKDGRPRPLPRPQRKLGPAPEIRPRKVGGPGTPPVYPKPTPTNTLPRPSNRSSIKFTPGHASDADSVMTEDFENQFKDLLITRDNQPCDSDADTVSNDPIHTKVKELLKATAKYAGKPLAPVSNSILKSQLRQYSDKPKIDPKPKQHVRISAKPPQYQEENQGGDSDDTLCSEKEGRVTSSRANSYTDSFWEPYQSSPWRKPTSSESMYYPKWMEQPWSHSKTTSRNNASSSPSTEDNLSKASLSLSQSSLSSSDVERHEHYQHDSNHSQSYRYRETNLHHRIYDPGTNVKPDRCLVDSGLQQGPGFQRQVSQISSTSSAFSSASSTFSSTSDYTESCYNSNYTNKAESRRDISSQNYITGRTFQDAKDTPSSSSIARRRSSYDTLSYAPYERKNQAGNESTMKRDKHGRKQRDLIVQDEEEEQYPFAKYTFNKKPTRSDDSTSSVSTSSRYSSSRDSVHSISLLKQQAHIERSKMMISRPSTASLLSSANSSIYESPGSPDELNGTSSGWRHKSFQSQNSSTNLFNQNMGLNGGRQMRCNVAAAQGEFYRHDTSSVPLAENTEELLKNYGLDEARSILPERFMKSWMDNVLTNQKKEIETRLMLSNQDNGKMLFNSDAYYVDDSDFLPPSVSAQQSGESTPHWSSSLEYINMSRHTQDQKVGQRIGPRLKFRRSQTSTSSLTGNEDSMNDFSENFEFECSKADAMHISKQNSFDKLKHILQSNDPLVSYRDRDQKRNKFASARQKSLPIFLETLSEEEDDRNQGSWDNVDNKHRQGYISNMKTFLEEEENLSIKNSISSSDDTGLSGTSLNNRINSGPASLRNSISTADDEESSELCSMERKSTDNKISLPSILVSENEVFKFNIDTAKQEKKSNIVPDRPTSPNPDNQSSLDKSVFKSKDSLEIAEIMNSSDKKVPKTNTLSSMLQQDKGRPFVLPIAIMRRTEKRNSSGSSSGKFLSINSEHDDKYLSPASSIASPLIMSPVTVIEAKNLDNQNDSLELDDNKDTDSSMTNSMDKHHKHNNHVRIQTHRKASYDESARSNSRSGQRSDTPIELSLERRHHMSYEPTTDTDSDEVFREISQNSKSLENADVSLQADTRDLPPLLNLTEMSQLLKDMCSRLPSQIKENLFYMAQDQGVQCELMTKINTDTDTTGHGQFSEIIVQNSGPNVEKTPIKLPLTETSETVYSCGRNIHSKTKCYNGELTNSQEEIDRNNVIMGNGNNGENKDVQTMGEADSDICALGKKSFIEWHKKGTDHFTTEVFLFVGSNISNEEICSSEHSNGTSRLASMDNVHHVRVSNRSKDHDFLTARSSAFQEDNSNRMNISDDKNQVCITTNRISIDDEMECKADTNGTECFKDKEQVCTVINCDLSRVTEHPTIAKSVFSVLVHEPKGYLMCNRKEARSLVQTERIKHVSTLEIACNVMGQTKSDINVCHQNNRKLTISDIPSCRNLSDDFRMNTLDLSKYSKKENSDVSLRQRSCITNSMDVQRLLPNELEACEDLDSFDLDESYSLGGDVWRLNALDNNNKGLKSNNTSCIRTDRIEIGLSNKMNHLTEDSTPTIYRSTKKMHLCFNAMNRPLSGIVAESDKLEQEKYKSDGDKQICYAHNSSLDKFSQLSSWSLDFDTLGSRKNILHRSRGTMFSQSFEGGLGPSVGDKQEEDTLSSEYLGYPDFCSSANDLRGGIEDVMNFNSNSNYIPRDSLEMLDESESSINDAFYANSITDNNGRVCMKNDSTHCALSDPNHVKKSKHNVVHFTDTFIKENRTQKNPVGILKCDKVVRSEDESKEIKQSSLVNEELAELTNALEELDRLYRSSVDDDAFLDEESIFDDTNNELENTNSNNYDLDNFMKELDYELNQIEMYASKLSQFQKHECKNCGHTAQFEVISDVCNEIFKVEHDFCSRCSPLDVSVETLERRRIMKNSL